MKKLCSLILFFVLATFFAYAQAPGYHLVKKTIVGGEGGWDYLAVDHDGGKLYLSHGNQVEVLDLTTHRKLTAITPANGVHGMVAIPKHNRLVVTNGRTSTAGIFDLKTSVLIAELPTGKNPDALLYDSYSDRVFIFNHSGGSATSIDVAAGKVIGTVDLRGEGVEAGVSDGEGTIFVNLEDTHEIVAFDAKSLTIKNRWSVAPGEEPTGLALDKVTHRLFSVCHNSKMIIVDSRDGKWIATVPIGQHVDGVVFDPDTKLAITSNGEGSMTVVREVSDNEFVVAETIATAPGARTITIDYKTHHIFVSTAQYGPADKDTNRRSVVPGTFMVLEYAPN